MPNNRNVFAFTCVWLHLSLTSYAVAKEFEWYENRHTHIAILLGSTVTFFSFSIYARTSNDMRNVGLDLGSATSTTTLIMMLHQNESASALSVYYFLIVSGSDYCTPSYQKLCIRKRFAFVFYPQRLFGLSFIYFRTISRFESCVANTMEMLRVSWLTGMRLWRCKLVYGFFLSSFSSFILSFHQRMELQPHLNFMWASILMPYIHPNRRLFAHQRCPTYSLVQHGQFSEAKIPKTVALCVGESSNP